MAVIYDDVGHPEARAQESDFFIDIEPWAIEIAH